MPSIMIVCVALVLPYFRSVRRRAVNQGGPLLLRALRPRVRLWSSVFFAFFCLALIVQWSVLLTGTVPVTELAPAVINTIIPLLVLLLHGMGLNGSYLEMRENGIVFGLEFWSWGNIRGYNWIDAAPTLRLRLAGHGIADHRIAASQKDAMDHLLREKVPGEKRVG